MAVQIQWRRDTAANWTAADPTLAQGEAGYETDTGKLKVGDGLLPWSLLPYYSAGAVGLGLSAGTQSVATGTVVFSNSNGISFGMSGSSRVTASYTVPSTAGLISAINVSGGTTSNNLSALTFSDGGNVSFGLNGSVITASAPAGGGGALSVGMSTIGNTSGDTGLVESRFVLAGGNNITLSGNTGALNRMTITVSGPNVVLPSAGTQTAASGTVVFANSNSITFGMSGSSQITASFSESTHSHATAAYSGSNGSFTANTVTFGNLNGLSFYTSNGSMVGSHNGITSQSGQAFSADASSTFQTLTFQNSNGVSFSNNAGALRVTHDLAGTTTAVTGRATLTLNSLGLRFDGGGLAGTGFTSTTTAGTAIVATNNTAGLSLAFPTIVTNAITTARASTDAIGLNTAQTNVTWTVNSSGLSLNAAGYAGTTTAVTGNAVLTLNSLGFRLDGSGLAGTSTGFAGANISGSMTHNSAGLNLSLSVAAPGAGGGMGMSAGTQSVSTGTMVFANSNGITFGMSGSSQITASYNSTQFAGTGTTFAGANASGSMTLNSNGLNLSVSVAAPGAAAEQNAINLLGANTAGNTTATGSTIGMSGINLTLSGTNASQIVFSAPATSSIVGISGISLSTAGSTVSIMPADVSYFAWPTAAILNTQTQTVASNTSVVFPIELHDLERFDFIMMPATVSIASMASIATAANNTKSYTQAATFNFVLYSRGIGASSQSLQSVLSTSHSSQMTIAIGQNANGSQWTVTHAFSFPATNTAQATFSTSYATSLTNVNVSTTHLTAISGAKKLGFPWATSLSDNQYWLMTGLMTAATTNGNASLSNMRVTQSMYAQSQVNLTWGEFGSANNASIQALYGIGSYTKAATGTTDSLGFSAISSSSSHNVPYISFARIA